MKAQHVIFGQGPVGRTLAQRLVAAGETVAVVTRSGKTVPGAIAIQADASDPKAARDAAEGAKVVYNCTNADYTRWPELLPQLFGSILEAAVSAGAKYVYTDNLYMYGRIDGRMHEALPNNPPGPKAALRARLADDVLKAHADKRVRAVIVRASDYYGPGVDGALLSCAGLAAMMKGKPLPTMGNLDRVHAFTFVPDLVTALVKVGADSDADGHVWFAPTAEAIPTRAMINKLAKALGVQPKIMNAKRPLVTLLGIFSPMMRTLKETLYQWEHSYQMDSTRFESAFGIRPTSIDEGVRITAESILAQAGQPLLGENVHRPKVLA